MLKGDVATLMAAVDRQPPDPGWNLADGNGPLLGPRPKPTGLPRPGKPPGVLKPLREEKTEIRKREHEGNTQGLSRINWEQNRKTIGRKHGGRKKKGKKKGGRKSIYDRKVYIVIHYRLSVTGVAFSFEGWSPTGGASLGDIADIVCRSTSELALRPPFPFNPCRLEGTCSAGM